MKYVVTKSMKRAVDLRLGDMFVVNDAHKRPDGSFYWSRVDSVRRNTPSEVEIGFYLPGSKLREYRRFRNDDKFLTGGA